jgi:hypothetical protein
MAKRVRVPGGVKPEYVGGAIVVGAFILLAQHFLAAEGESWLNKSGAWPR